MVQDPDARGYATMREFVTGEGSVSTVFSGLKGLPPDRLAEILARHRGELDAIDPARSVILESLLPSRRRRHA